MKALAEGVLALLADPTGRLAMGEAARARQGAEFSAHRMAARVSEVLERVVSGSPGVDKHEELRA